MSNKYMNPTFSLLVTLFGWESIFLCAFHKLYLYKEYKVRCTLHFINCIFITKETKYSLFFLCDLFKVSLKDYTYCVRFL